MKKTQIIFNILCSIALGGASGCGYVTSLVGGTVEAVGGAVAKSRADSANAADAAADNIEIPVGTGPRKRVGIVDFEDSSGRRYERRNQLATVASDAVTEILVNSKAFVVTEREQIVQILKEQGLGMTGAVSPQSAAKVGQLLGLQALITGKITDYDQGTSDSDMGVYAESKRFITARVSLRMIDATTGEVWAAESGEGKATETSASAGGSVAGSRDNNLGKRALYRALRKAAVGLVKVANEKPWSGTVAKVNRKNQVYVVAGSDSNIEAGTLLNVRRLGEEITDPTSGQLIGREVGELLGTIKVKSHINNKLTACEINSGRGFSEGDVVALAGAT